jgi:hypothetical protein
MKKVALNLFTVSFVFLMACQSGQQRSASQDAAAEVEVGPNQLTQQEIKEGWKLLFDGETSQGWRGVNKAHFPEAWTVVDGALMCKGSGRGEAGSEDGGDILYDQQFSNFLLRLEWKISEGGNSGIFYLGQEIEEWPIWKTAPEMQVLDNDKHPDSFMGVDGNRKAGALYDLIPANPQNTKPAGEWNSVEIMVYRGTVVHRQNGETVLEYHLWTDDWNKLVAGSKFPELNPDWANVAESGYIALQDHGDDVWFRNIRIKEL